jgi:hypothetical protein
MRRDILKLLCDIPVYSTPNVNSKKKTCIVTHLRNRNSYFHMSNAVRSLFRYEAEV